MFLYLTPLHVKKGPCATQVIPQVFVAAALASLEATSVVLD